MGRSPDLPPIVSNDIRTTRVWVADGQYIEDTTEGAVEGQPYWRRGWLGYSNIDRRYEWVTIAPRVPMMIYLGKPGSGEQMPIDVTGVFTDQGVVSEQTVGKPVVQRTVFRIESNDRHISELYFTPPGGKERLALRLVYTRIKSDSESAGDTPTEGNSRFPSFLSQLSKRRARIASSPSTERSRAKPMLTNDACLPISTKREPNRERFSFTFTGIAPIQTSS